MVSFQQSSIPIFFSLDLCWLGSVLWLELLRLLSKCAFLCKTQGLFYLYQSSKIQAASPAVLTSPGM